MARRTQQLALYAVERTVNRGPAITVEEAQELYDNLRDEEWWQLDYAQVLRVEVQGNPKSMAQWHAGEAAGLVLLSPTADLHTALHELAHVLAGARYGSTSHDPAFCRTLLELVFRVRGTDAWLELRAALESGDIIFDTEDS